MTTQQRRLRLTRLEGRISPAGLNGLVSLAESTLYSDAAGASLEQNRSSGPDDVRTVSADGRYVVFASAAPNLILGHNDTNGYPDVFLFDRVMNETQLISHEYGAALTSADGGSAQPTISADGRYVAFTSNATDLVAGFVPGYNSPSDVFLHDRMSGTTVLVSHRYDSTNIAGSYYSKDPRLSADGSVVVFSSTAVDLVPGFPSSNYSLHAYAYDCATGNVTLIDHKAGDPSIPLVLIATSVPWDISANGNLITFHVSNAVYIHNRLTGNNTQLTPGYHATISDDGQWVAFWSKATNLVPGMTGFAGQIYLYNTQTAKFSLVSHVPGSATAGGNAQTDDPMISDDGRYVTYTSQSTDLIDSFVDGNGSENYDCFLYDRMTDQTTLVSRKIGESSVSGNERTRGAPQISNDGRYVLYCSLATDLIGGFVDGNGTFINPVTTIGYDIFRFDRVTNSNELISRRDVAPTTSGNRQSLLAAWNATGSVVVWSSASSDIVSGVADLNGAEDVYCYDSAANSVTLLSARNADPSLSPGGDSQWVRQSADGRYLVFTSYASNIVPGQIDPHDSQDVFLFDRLTRQTVLVSRRVGTTTTAATAYYSAGSAVPVISADGRYVAYCSYSPDLVPGFVDGNGDPPDGTGLYLAMDVFLFDRVTGTNQLISHKYDADNIGGNNTSGTFQKSLHGMLSISDDGRYIAYRSQATDLVAGMIDNNGNSVSSIGVAGDVLVFDRMTNTNTLISHMPGSPLSTGNSNSSNPVISGDGQVITYWGTSTTLVTGMTGGGGRNVFVYDRNTQITSLVSHAFSSPTASGNGGSNGPVISRDGKYVVYQSASNNIVANQIDFNNRDDIFLYERATGSNTLVSHVHHSLSQAGNMTSDVPGEVGWISDDGRFVAYESGAGDLIPNFIDGNGGDPMGGSNMDAFLYDRLTGVNVLVSRTAALPNQSGNRQTFGVALSGDGRFVTFASTAGDLIDGFAEPAGTSGDIYVFDRLSSTVKLVSHGVGNETVPGNYLSQAFPTISRDGNVISYWSLANNIANGDYNGFYDVYWYSNAPAVQSVTIADGSAQRSVVRSVTIAFDQFIPFTGDPAAAFSLARNGGVVSGQWSVASVSNNPNTVVTLNFTGPVTEFGSLIDGKYTLTALAAAIPNLDGNNDGFAGDDYVFNFHRLFGDADGNATVNTVDFNALRSAFGSTSFIFDFNNTGSVDTADFNQFRIRFGSIV